MPHVLSQEEVTYAEPAKDEEALYAQLDKIATKELKKNSVK